MYKTFSHVGYDNFTSKNTDGSLLGSSMSNSKYNLDWYANSKEVGEAVDKWAKSIDDHLGKATDAVSQGSIGFTKAAEKMELTKAGNDMAQRTNDLMKANYYLRVSVLPTAASYLAISFISFLILGGVLLWLFVRYIKKRDVKNRSIRHFFGCCCCTFGLLAAFALVSAISLLPVSQILSEGCHVVEKDFITNGLWSNYTKTEFLAPHHSFLDACATVGGSGSILKAMVAGGYIKEEEIKILETTREDVRGDVESLKKQVKSDLAVTNGFLESQIPTVVLMFNLPDYAPTAAYAEVLYGGIHSAPIKFNKAEYAYTINQMKTAGNLRCDAESYGNFSEDVRKEFNKTPPPSAEGIMQYYTMEQQCERLSKELNNLGISECNLRVCATSNCCNGSEKDTCYEIDGHRTFFHLIRDKLTVTEAMVTDVMHKAQFWTDAKDTTMIDCVDKMPTVVDKLLWMNSHFLITMRRKMLEEKVFVAVSRTTGLPEEVDYKTFTTSMMETWNSFYSLAYIESGFAKADESLFQPLSRVMSSFSNCQVSASLLKSSRFVCQGIFGNLGLSGFGFFLLFLASLTIAILSWKIFHHFVDNMKHFTKSFFFQTIDDGESEAVMKLCRNLNVPQLRDPDGNSGLHHAAYFGHPDVCQELVERGCDINEVNQAGFTPLSIAVYASSEACVKVLAKSGADPTICNRFGETPLESAKRRAPPNVLEAMRTVHADQKPSPP